MYLIVLIFLISIFSIRFSENFTCNRNLYYTNKIFRPFRMIIVDNSNFNSKNNIDSIINRDVINKALLKIKITTHDKDIIEHPHSRYDYKKGFTGKVYDKSLLDSINKKLAETLLQKISVEITSQYGKLCNNNCDLKFNGYRIKRLGITDKSLVVEGQQLFEMINGTKKFMIEYIVINNNNFDVIKLKLGGIEYKKIVEENELEESDVNHNNLNILGSPLYGKYELPKTHLYSSLETDLKPKNKFKNIDKFSYFCYGKKALNKIECEKIDNSNVRGVWDKACSDDRECPFYYYGSKNGGCNKGQCEFPIGVDRISPRKYLNLENAICGGCKTSNGIKLNGTCCISQKNKKLYPNLIRPNYIFS